MVIPGRMLISLYIMLLTLQGMTFMKYGWHGEGTRKVMSLTYQ